MAQNFKLPTNNSFAREVKYNLPIVSIESDNVIKNSINYVNQKIFTYLDLIFLFQVNQYK